MSKSILAAVALIFWFGFVATCLPACRPERKCQPGEKACEVCEKCPTSQNPADTWLEACSKACGSHGMLMGDYTHTNCVCLGIVAGPPLSPEQR
jgi:hypothetical protein